MKKTMLRTNEWYDVIRPNNSGGLVIYDMSSVENVVQQIGEIEAHAAENGYGPEKWLIVRYRTNTIYDSDFDGENIRFRFRSTTEEAVAEYYDGKVTYLNGKEE